MHAVAGGGVVGGWGGRGGCGERERVRAHACRGGRERESAWLLLLYIFLPLGLPYANWAQPGVLFYLKSSLRSSDLPLVYFHGLFPSLSFSHHHFGLLFPILTTYGTNKGISRKPNNQLPTIDTEVNEAPEFRGQRFSFVS